MAMTLYHYWRSSCSWRVRWALALKKQAYTSVPVNILASEHSTRDYKDKNPTGFLPALSVNGQCFGESLAIIDWLDETWPEPALYPREAFARLRARQLALTIATGTQPLQNPSLLAHFVAKPDERKAQAQHFISRGLGVYETLLERNPERGPFSCGDTVTVADLCLVPQVYNAERFAVDLSPFPRVASIYQACLKTEACDEAAPHRFEPK